MKPEYNKNMVSERLNIALKKREMTQTELADLTGINFSTISSYVSGRFEPKRTPLLEMAKVLRVSPAWLAGFDVGMEEEVPSYDSSSGILTIPFINQKLSAGVGENYLSSDDISIRKIDILSSMARGIDKSTLVAAEVIGDSMIEEKIYSGDIAVFSKGMIRGSVIYVINYGGDVLVKKILFDSMENKVTIISANKDYPPKTTDSDCVSIIGKVIGWIHLENY